MTPFSDLTQKTVEELTKLVADQRAEIRELRFKIATRQESKVRAYRRLQKDIARLETALTRKKPSPSL